MASVVPMVMMTGRVGLVEIEQVLLIHPVEGNAVFVQMPTLLIDALHDAGWHFYTFIGSGHARFMCSWQTTAEDVVGFAGEVKRILGLQKI
ncbi:MAG: hypothetical protein L3J47_03940 [Sulfurovum sp.]|nr:hypothetical protein [Sulfurovum sp.]